MILLKKKAWPMVSSLNLAMFLKVIFPLREVERVASPKFSSLPFQRIESWLLSWDPFGFRGIFSRKIDKVGKKSNDIIAIEDSKEWEHGNEILLSWNLQTLDWVGPTNHIRRVKEVENYFSYQIPSSFCNLLEEMPL